MPYAVAVDIGGTFTDLVAYDAETRRVAYAKSPTTYGNLVDGVLDCFAKAKLEPHAASFVNHGTTLVINALIQRKGAKAALVTTSAPSATLIFVDPSFRHSVHVAADAPAHRLSNRAVSS